MEVPIPVIDLFPVLDRHLIDLLRSLKEDDWSRPTLAKRWTVKDIASHLLDGNFRTISMLRDGHFGEKAENIQSYEDLVSFLNKLNNDWVTATKRLSPKVLVDLLETSGQQYYEHLSKLDMFKPAPFSVAWAGETESLNWFHIAREYTEKWHHQQQIREAVKDTDNIIMTRELYHPVLRTFMCALPYNYRNVSSTDNTAIQVTITGNAGGTWTIRKQEGKWAFSDSNESIATHIEISQNNAWKLFTKAFNSQEIDQKVKITGDTLLARPFLSMITVMA